MARWDGFFIPVGKWDGIPSYLPLHRVIVFFIFIPAPKMTILQVHEILTIGRMEVYGIESGEGEEGSLYFYVKVV